MRLIDADALRDFLTQDEIRLRKEYDKENDDTILAWIQESEFIQNKIQEMPTVDAEPIRHGHWFDEEVEEAGGIYTHTRCSSCGEYILCDAIGQKIESPYCPWCGAKMDEVEE